MLFKIAICPLHWSILCTIDVCYTTRLSLISSVITCLPIIFRQGTICHHPLFPKNFFDVVDFSFKIYTGHKSSMHCQLQFILSTEPTLNQLEQAVQYKYRRYGTLNEWYFSSEINGHGIKRGTTKHLDLVSGVRLNHR